MRLSSSYAALSAIALLSTVLLCDTAASQTASGSAAPLPGITVQAPKQVARPQRPVRAVNTAVSRRTSSAARTATSAGHTSTARRLPATADAVVEGPGSALGKLATLEKMSSSCNGGCETSVKTGDAPWVGCSLSGGYFSTFSATCRDTLTYASYRGCMDTKIFTGWDRNRAWWYCTSLAAGKKFKVAELKRPRR